jgi:hypothetical protein
VRKTRQNKTLISSLIVREDQPKQATVMAFKAEYIWIDGTEPTAKLRSKTKSGPPAVSVGGQIGRKATLSLRFPCGA